MIGFAVALGIFGCFEGDTAILASPGINPLGSFLLRFGYAWGVGCSCGTGYGTSSGWRFVDPDELFDEGIFRNSVYRPRPKKLFRYSQKDKPTGWGRADLPRWPRWSALAIQPLLPLTLEETNDI